MTPASFGPLDPALPSRALLIAPTVERAATLGVAFDHVQAVTLDDLDAVLTAEGKDLPCVAVTGVPTRGGRLAQVVGQVLASCTDGVQVVLDHSEPLGSELLAQGSQSLRGLALLDRIDLAGVPCLRFRPALDRENTPDLAPLRDELIGHPGAQAQLALAVDALVAPAQAARYEERIAALEAEVARATESLHGATASLTKTKAERTAAVDALGRLQRNPLVRGAVLVERARAKGLRELRKSPKVKQLTRKATVVAAGVVLVTTDAVVIALVTKTGKNGAVLTVLVLVSVAELAYAARSARRVAALDRRVASADRARSGQDGKVAAAASRGQAKAAEALADLSDRLRDVERNLAIVTATSVDTAHAVAKLLHGAGDPADGTASA